MARTAVTPSAVRSFLERTMDGNNYHLLFGLHLLKPEHFEAVFDALLNGDAQVEDLVRLGSFSEPEVEAFIQDVLGSWVSPAVAVPTVAAEGYAYLSQNLGLTDLLQASTVPTAGINGYAYLTRDLELSGSPPVLESEGGPVATILGIEIPLGGEWGYASVGDVHALFQREVLNSALGGLAFTEVFPLEDDQILRLPLSNADDARRALLLRWFRRVFSPLSEPLGDFPALSEGTAAGLLLSVGSVESRLRRFPALAEWLIRTPRPDERSHLLLHREAVERSAAGPYSLGELDERIVALETSLEPDFVSTPYKFAKLDFQLRVVRAALTFIPDAPPLLAQRLGVVEDVVATLYNHRARLRAFIKNSLHGARQRIRGHFPAA